MQSITEILGLLNVRGVLCLCIVFIPLERLLAMHRGQRVFRKWWWNDLFYHLFNGIPIKVGLFVLIAAIGVAARWVVPEVLRAAVAGQPLSLPVGEAILLADVGFYLRHRMFHTVPWLWKFHAVHHSIEELDWLAAAASSTRSTRLRPRRLSFLPLFALGFATVPIGIFMAIYFWHGYFLHANVRLNFGPLRWLITLAGDFHHWHHAERRKGLQQELRLATVHPGQAVRDDVHAAGPDAGTMPRQRAGAAHVHLATALPVPAAEAVEAAAAGGASGGAGRRRGAGGAARPPDPDHSPRAPIVGRGPASASATA